MIGRVLIWGNGSVGSGLAVILSEKFEVALMGPPGCAERTLFLSAEGFFKGRAEVMQMPADSSPDGDCSIIAVKAGELQSLAGLLRSHPGYTDGSILPALCVTNGMGLESLWGTSWGEDIEPAVLTAGFRLRDDGVVETSQGSIIVEDGGIGDHLFRATDLEVKITSEMRTVRWAKWLANSVINPLGALTGLRNCQLREAGLETLIEALGEELLSVVPTGIRDEVHVLAGDMLDFLLSRSENFCSMLQDLESGRETEIDYLTGLSFGEPPGTLPLAEALTSIIKARIRV